MIEVAQYDDQTVVLRTECMLYRDLDMIEGDEGCSRGWAIGGLDMLGCNIFIPLNQQNYDPFVRPASSYEVIREGAIGDPFLENT